MNDPLLILKTLKVHDKKTQIAEIDRLSIRFQNLAVAIYALIEKSFNGKLFVVHFLGDKIQLVRLALLAIVATDMTSIPDRESRERYFEKLDALGDHFGISRKDILLVMSLVSAFEELFQD